MSNKIVLLKNAIPDVMEQIACAPKNVRIYSPYLTSDVAETVIKAADQTTAQVFTTFKAETFATGGSFIETLRSVFDSQFQIFSVPDLHAKIVITDYAILIGSQNLTRGGTKNREATANSFPSSLELGSCHSLGNSPGPDISMRPFGTCPPPPSFICC